MTITLNITSAFFLFQAQTSYAVESVVNRASIPIQGQYIVVFKDTVKDPRAEVANLNRAGTMRVKHIYDVALKGFAAEIPDVALNALRNNPRVQYIEQDQTVTINATQSPVPSWGLDRVDVPNLYLNNDYNYASTGNGIVVYVIDTGILTSHIDFGGRALIGYDAVGDGQNGNDCNGHGTHVAGTIGGATHGIAKGVTLVAVRVLNCSGSGSISGVVAGVNWVVSNLGNKIAVANMSLGGGASSSLDTAVNNAVAANVVFAVAAGNSNRDACRFSPARAASAITVGATTTTSANGDTRASYSNFGACLDIFAPGSSITSSWNNSDTDTNTISGTSMASPHVAGVAALLRQKLGSSILASQIWTAMQTNATTSIVYNAGSKSPNRLLYNPPK